MALSRKVGSFNIGLGAPASTVVVSGVGFVPKVILFWWTGRTTGTDGAGRATHLRGFGFTVGTGATDSRAVCSRALDAADTSTVDAGHREDACVVEQGDAALVGWADLQSFDADGFTLEILDAFVTNLRVGYLALGGADLTNVASGLFNSTAGTPPFDQAVTAVGFQPDFLLLMCGGFQLGNPPGTAAGLGPTIGMATGATNEFVVHGASRDAQLDVNSGSYGFGDEIFAAQTTVNPGVGHRGEFKTFDADGFTLTWLTSQSGVRIHYLALKLGGNVKVGDLLTQTDTVTDIAVTGLGFTPKAVLFLSHTKAESVQGTVQDHDQWSAGAATAITERAAQGLRDQDAAADSIVTTGIEHDEVYVNLDGTGVVGLMDLKSMDADGFTCIMDDADPAQAFVGYVAFGETAAPAADDLATKMIQLPELSNAPGMIAISGG